VRIFMPSATGVVHEAGVPGLPSISTRHSRQDPNASRLSVAHSLGMSIPDRAAARMTDVPGGTVTGWPSTSTDTVASPETAGVPRSGSLIKVIGLPPGAA
jgi:hypothetical protein